MPIYEYQCQSCQKVFEFIQKMSDDPMTECEECKGELSRMISQSAFHLKGGGWYKDLYSSTKKDSGGSDSGGSDSGGSDSGGSDS
ncbi:MAG: zinc ribbon domain-containing protein, partial [Kofleriaceae bacterium]|nr:zinc ribbon domain-containing protein [Kofleriaceae bacterium]